MALVLEHEALLNSDASSLWSIKGAIFHVKMSEVHSHHRSPSDDLM